MKAYVIVGETVRDQATFDRYRAAVPATLAPFGGQFLVRGGEMTVVEGQWEHPRVVVIEFPSRSTAEGWYRSAAYQEILPLRLGSAAGALIIVDGPA